MRRLWWLLLAVLSTSCGGCTLYVPPAGGVLVRVGMDTSAKEITFESGSATQPARCVVKDLQSTIDPAVAAALYAAGRSVGAAETAAALAATRPAPK